MKFMTKSRSHSQPSLPLSLPTSFSSSPSSSFSHHHQDPQYLDSTLMLPTTASRPRKQLILNIDFAFGKQAEVRHFCHVVVVAAEFFQKSACANTDEKFKTAIPNMIKYSISLCLFFCSLLPHSFPSFSQFVFMSLSRGCLSLTFFPSFLCVYFFIFVYMYVPACVSCASIRMSWTS